MIRTCGSCNAIITFIDKKGRSHWYHHDDKWYCNNCDNRLFKNPKWHPITMKRRVCFRNKQKYIGKNPRTGECSECHKKIGDTFINFKGKTITITKTHIHHREYYEGRPLDKTVELCPSCHMKEGWRSGSFIKAVVNRIKPNKMDIVTYRRIYYQKHREEILERMKKRHSITS